jgi:hypothetical protein
MDFSFIRRWIPRSRLVWVVHIFRKLKNEKCASVRKGKTNHEIEPTLVGTYYPF